MKREDGMRFLVTAALVVLVLGGCATTPIRSSDAVPAPKERLHAFQERTEKTTAKITITRDAGIVGSACYIGVRINGINSARIGYGETSSFYVEPGEILLSVGFDIFGNTFCGVGSLVTRETYLRDGETKFFRISLDPMGGMDITRSEIQ